MGAADIQEIVARAQELQAKEEAAQTEYFNEGAANAGADMLTQFEAATPPISSEEKGAMLEAENRTPLQRIAFRVNSSGPLDPIIHPSYEEGPVDGPMPWNMPHDVSLEENVEIGHDLRNESMCGT